MGENTPKSLERWAILNLDECLHLQMSVIPPGDTITRKRDMISKQSPILAPSLEYDRSAGWMAVNMEFIVE